MLTPDPEYGTPKALLEVGGVPRVKLIDHHIAWLGLQGAKKVIVGAGDQLPVATYTRDRYAKNPNVAVATSLRQLGTAGDLLHALHEEPELFGDQTLVINADTIVQLAVNTLLESHRNRGNDMTVALTQIEGVPNYNKYGLDEHDRVVACGEIDEEASVVSAVQRGSSMGATVVSTEFLQSIDWTPAMGPLSLYTNLVAEAFRRGTLSGFNAGKAFMMDVGTEATFTAATQNADNVLDPYLCRP